MPKLAIDELESLGLVFALLPGLLTFLVIRWLTGRERKLESLEALLFGLAYTLLTHAIWSVLTLGSLIPTPDLVGLSLSAVGLGLFLAYLTNNGHVYKILRSLGITEEASWPTIWETAFRIALRNDFKYAVFHLKDGRRIMGAVRGYSALQTGSHIAIDRASWLVDETESGQGPDSSHETSLHPNKEKVTEQIPADGLMLFPAENIEFVQFLPPNSGSENE